MNILERPTSAIDVSKMLREMYLFKQYVAYFYKNMSYSIQDT